MATVEFHIATGRRFMEQAEGEFSVGDVMQASEKGWGAAAHAVKAIAERRRWRHKSHRDLNRAARRIANELGRPRIRELFRRAGMLHENYYEGSLTEEEVEWGLARVRELRQLLEGVAR